MGCKKPGFPVHQQLPEFAQTHVHWVGDAIQPPHPLSYSSSFAFYLSQHQGLFQWVGSSHQEAKVWKFSFSNSPSDEYSRFISFRIDRFDLHVVQRTFKSLLQSPQFESINSSVLSHRTGKTITLTIRIFVSKVISLLFNTLSRFVVVFLRSKCLSISWLQSPSAVILEPKKIKSATVSTFTLFASQQISLPQFPGCWQNTLNSFVRDQRLQ